MAEVDFRFAFSLPPEKAVEYFQAKGMRLTFNWHEMLEQAHHQAFTVAKVTKLDVLQTIRDSVDKILTEGISQAEFIKQLQPQLENAGWWGKASYTAGDGTDVEYTMGSVRRLKTIYQTNASVPYAQGRYQAQLENVDAQPYLMYSAVLDGRTRPAHRALNGTVKPFDDIFWNYYTPPNGWRCRCYTISLSAEAAQRYGYEISYSTAADYQTRDIEIGTDKRTGEVRMGNVTTYTDHTGAKYSTDAGWNYNPAKTTYTPDLSKYDDDLRSAAR